MNIKVIKEEKFQQFQEYFKKYQTLFGLLDYKVYFKHETIDAFADISISQENMVVTARWSKRLPKKDQPFEDAKQSAKHEALHLLLGRLADRAQYRFISKTELYEIVEGLVFKLEGLIPDIDQLIKEE